MGEWQAKQTHCKNGHEFDSVRMSHGKAGRACSTCSKARKKRYYADGRYNQRDRNDAYRRRYGISLDEYNAMFSAQKGLCAICGDGSRRHLHVDHDHDTKQVRALLCQHCNIGIGNFFDDADRLQAAAAYIERWRTN